MYDTTEQTPAHHLLNPALDERTHQAFAKHLRQFVFGPARGAAREAHERRVAPALAAQAPAVARDRARTRDALLRESEYQFFCDLHRISQEQIWSATADSVEREAGALRAQFLSLGTPKGTLALDPALAVPEYLRAMDTHCMPGGYHTDWMEHDLSNGAIYERGSFLYAPGGGPRNEAAGLSSLDYLRTHAPGFVPRRLLDLGCGTASPLLPWAEAFPEAELHGLDIGAPLLRYAHLRAERLGIALHLRQADAAATGYPDGHFDLVTSHIMFHETSAEAVPAILAEASRVLSPGGMLLIVDLPNAALIPDVFQQVIFEGDAHYNNEHFWMRMHELDWPAQLSAAGFSPPGIGMAPMQMYSPSGWTRGRFGLFAVLARKPAKEGAR